MRRTRESIENSRNALAAASPRDFRGLTLAPAWPILAQSPWQEVVTFRYWLTPRRPRTSARDSTRRSGLHHEFAKVGTVRGCGRYPITCENVCLAKPLRTYFRRFDPNVRKHGLEVYT